jgi:hypothetical protein
MVVVHAIDTLLLFQVLVCMIDLIYPPKPLLVQTTNGVELEKKKEQDSGDKQFSGDELVRLNTFSCSACLFVCFILSFCFIG